MQLTDILIILLILMIAVLAVAVVRRSKKDNDENIRKDIAQKFNDQNELTLRLMANMNASYKADTEAMRNSVDNRLRQIQLENSKKLDELRNTVDNRLQRSVSAGIEGSFKTVSGQLSTVAQTIGELKEMSGEITSLKKILGGVKTRGIWGEAQLEAILSDMLPPDGYMVEYSVKATRERVDFAVKLPGEDAVLPIDSKFPMDRYSEVISACEAAEQSAIKRAEDALKRSVIEQAKRIRKYISPPQTTDFAVMFIPSEAIYAHLCSMNISGVIMKELGVMIAGPSIISALVSAIDMGCVKFAVQEKSAQILLILKETQKEIDKLSQSAASAKRNIELASSHIDDVKKRTDKLGATLSGASKL